MTARQLALTTRGRVMTAAAALLALGGYLFGVEELYALAAAAAVLTGLSLVWVALSEWDVEVHRQLHPVRVPAGAEARVELTVRNRGKRRTPPVQAADPFDGGRRWARFTIAPLEVGELRRATYRLPTTRRGIYHLGPLELAVGDPFALARATRTTAADTSLTVHPRFDRVSARTLSTHRDDDRRLHQPMIGRAGSEFFALRQYVAGDDLRHVHWPSTARLDDLVIRQPESMRRGRVTVLADLRAEVHDGESVEGVLSAVATLAMSSLRSGMQVRVVTTSGADSGYGSGRAHGAAILDELAAAESRRAGSADPFRLAGRHDPLTLVTTDRASEGDLEAAVGIGGAAGTTTVVFETAGAARPLPAGRRRGVRVPVDGQFARSWEAAQC